MRLTAGLVAAGVLGLLALWLGGGLDALAQAAIEVQRSLTRGLAAGVAGLRRGEPGALGALLLAAATYGVAHAAGPGHGKALIGATAAGTSAGAGRLAAIALAGSLGQGVTAIVIVAGGLTLLGGGITALAAQTERVAETLGMAALGGVGLWLGWRGLRALRHGGEGACHAHCHDHGHHHPTAADVPGTAASLALAGAIAMRPCAGAMLTLAIAWGAGVAWAGVLAVLAMSLGTAVVTVASALAAHGARRAALVAGGSTRLGMVAAGLQAGAGLLAVAIAATALAA
jgi:ABC-type nickel/cobalt efflux system permease component RcnA